MATLRTRRSIDGYNFSISQDLCMLSRFRLGSPVYSLQAPPSFPAGKNVASDDVRFPPPPFLFPINFVSLHRLYSFKILYYNH
jgi:hypothetical protein